MATKRPKSLLVLSALSRNLLARAGVHVRLRMKDGLHWPIARAFAAVSASGIE